MFLFQMTVSILLAVNTAAILLPVHVQFFGGGNPFLPAFPEILIIKINAYRCANGSADGFNQVVVLKFAVEQGGGKAVKISIFGDMGRRE